MIVLDYPNNDTQIIGDIHVLPKMWLVSINSIYYKIDLNICKTEIIATSFVRSTFIDEVVEKHRKLKARWTMELAEQFRFWQDDVRGLIEAQQAEEFNKIIEDEASNVIFGKYTLTCGNLGIGKDGNITSADNAFRFGKSTIHHLGNTKEELVIRRAECFKILKIPNIIEAKLSFDEQTILVLGKKIIILDNPLMDAR